MCRLRVGRSVAVCMTTCDVTGAAAAAAAAAAAVPCFLCRLDEGCWVREAAVSLCSTRLGPTWRLVLTRACQVALPNSEVTRDGVLLVACGRSPAGRGILTLDKNRSRVVQLDFFTKTCTRHPSMHGGLRTFRRACLSENIRSLLHVYSYLYGP